MTTTAQPAAPEEDRHSVGTLSEYLERLGLPHLVRERPVIKNANDEYQKTLSPLDRLAVAITDRVGSMGFFFAIMIWTVLWTGYNILASEVPFFYKTLHWHAFDPFPAFVAYLLMSNVIQILLMPLIMVGQNVQGRHTEIRAELDFEINKKAEQEILIVLQHLERNTELILQLMRHLQCQISEEELRAIAAETGLAARLDPVPKPAEA